MAREPTRPPMWAALKRWLVAPLIAALGGRAMPLSDSERRSVLILVALLLQRIPVASRYYRRVLATWQLPERRGVLGRLVYPVVLRVWSLDYFAERDPDVREAKKALLLGGASALAWARHTARQPLDLAAPYGNLTLRQAKPVYRAVESVMRLAAEHGTSVCAVQVGCHSGREIAWVARQFPDADCLGIDVYPEVVRFAAGIHRLPNLRFETLAAKDIGQVVDRAAAYQLLMVFSSACLYLVQPEHLDVFFAELEARRRGPLHVVLTEPVAAAVDVAALAGSCPRDYMSYNHNYQLYAERRGFGTIEWQVVQAFDDGDPSSLTAQYFWQGTRGPRLEPPELAPVR